MFLLLYWILKGKCINFIFTTQQSSKSERILLPLEAVLIVLVFIS